MNQSTTNEKPKEAELSDEDFLSPEESELLLGSLEIQDRNTIGSDRPAPAEPEAEYYSQGDFPDVEDNLELPLDLHSSGNSLAKIGAELKLLKAELLALKAHRIRAESDLHPPASPRIDYSEPSRELSKEFMEEVKTLLAYLDRLLEALPEEKIDEFGRSDYFELYKKVFKTLKIS
jgi:hypothetical protein